MVNFTVGYGRKFAHSFIKSAKIKLEVNNVLDREVQIKDNFNAAGVLLYSVLPKRNYFLTISSEF